MKKVIIVLLVAVVLSLTACKPPEDELPTDIDCEVEVCTYTFRQAGSSAANINPHMYQTSSEAGVLGRILGGLYTGELQLENEGRKYDYVPEMADGDPVCVQDPATIVDNKCLEWQIPLRSDLTFHDGKEIDAYTFIDTYYLLLDPGYLNYRANTFFSGFVVENAKAYYLKGRPILDEDKDKERYEDLDTYPEDLSFDDVGVKALDENTLYFKLEVPEKDDEEGIFRLKGMLSSYLFSPVDVDMYEELTIKDQATGFLTTEYGSTLEKINGHGAYKLVQWDRGIKRVYEKWDGYRYADDVEATSIVEYIYKDAETDVKEFQLGNLDVMGVPSKQYDHYKDNIFLKRSPSTATWSLRVNSTGREGGGTEETNALLANVNFRKALYLAVDRAKLQENLLQFHKKSQYILSSAYLSDELSNVEYRTTDEAKSVYADYYPETYGFNADAAVDYYNQARQELLEEHGISLDTKITVEIQYGNQGGTFEDIAEWLQQELHGVFGEDNFGIRIEGVDTGMIYSNMISGQYDIGIGAWLGGLTDPWSIMEVYTSSFDKQMEYGYKNKDLNVLYQSLVNDEAGTLQGVWNEVTESYEPYKDINGNDLPLNIPGMKFADSATRLQWLAIQEKLLVDDMVVIPLFENVSVALYHERIELPLSEPLPVVGWGASDMTIEPDQLWGIGE